MALGRGHQGCPRLHTQVCKGPTTGEILKKGQKILGREKEGIKREKQKHGPQDERKEGGTSGLGADISL